MSNLVNIYVEGGVAFMHPITLALLLNTVIIGYIVYSQIRNKVIHANWLEAVKHIGGFAVALGTFRTLVGLFLAFNALENSKQVIPFQVIMGGLKVALINILYGLIVFFFSMLAYMILKLKDIKRVGYEA